MRDGIISHIYFDMDDTLTRTTDYFVGKTREILLRNGNLEDLSEFEDFHKNGNTRFTYPKKFSELNSAIAKTKEYMSEVLPTPLFNYFFLIPGNQPPSTKFGIITHRGASKDSYNRTRGWFDKFTLAADISEIHSIHPSKHPSKIKYLEKLHPEGNFLLVDDNPLYNTSIEHPFSPNIRLYDKYSNYGDAYKNQRKVIEKNGLFIL